MCLNKDKSGDTVGRPSWRSSLPGDPGAKCFCGKPQHMKNSLNFANTCLKIVDTRRCCLQSPDLSCKPVKFPAPKSTRRLPRLSRPSLAALLGTAYNSSVSKCLWRIVQSRADFCSLPPVFMGRKLHLSDPLLTSTQKVLV